MWTRDRRRARRGFTLLEGAAALVILGMTGAAAMAALAADLRSASRVGHALVAEALLQQRLAVMRLAAAERPGRLPDSLRHGVFPAPFADYRWRATREPVRGEDDLIRLSVEVEWRDGARRLTTLDLVVRDAAARGARTVR